VPNFKYQLQLAGPEVQANIVGKEKLRQFLNGIYGGIGPKGELPFTTATGVLFENLDKVGPTPLLSPEEVEFYVEQYDIHGMRGPLNWYRTRKINFDDELALVEAGRTKITAPSMVVTATKDAALPPAMALGMEKHFNSLITRQVEAGHWALWQAAEHTNQHIGEFLSSVVKGGSLFKASI